MIPGVTVSSSPDLTGVWSVEAIGPKTDSAVLDQPYVRTAAFY